MASYKLVGAPVSLYTGKVRSYLNYKGVPYEEVLATREVYQNLILPRTGVRYIPVLVSADDQVIQDSTEIIDFIEARVPERSVYPNDPVQRLVALLLEVYADEWLVIPAMHYRWNFAENVRFAQREFGYTSRPDLPEDEQLELGKTLSQPFAGALPRLGVLPHTAPAIEASYLALLSDLNRHFAQHAFLLGSRPSIGDFGLIGPLYAHLYRDPFSGRLMKQRAPNVAGWVERMISREFDDGSWSDPGSLPATLQPVLSRMFSEQGPVIARTLEQLHLWAIQNPGRPVPRSIGECPFAIEGVEGHRLTFPYLIWMWQRVHDHYHGLAAEDKARSDAALQGIAGATELLNVPISSRVERVNNRLEIKTRG